MIFKIFIILLLVFMGVGADLQSEGYSPEEMKNLAGLMSYDELNLSEIKEGANDKNNSFIIRGIFKYADFLSFVGIEGVASSAQYGYDNPQYNYVFMWKVLVALMLLSVSFSVVLSLIYLSMFFWFLGVNIREVLLKMIDRRRRRK